MVLSFDLICIVYCTYVWWCVHMYDMLQITSAVFGVIKKLTMLIILISCINLLKYIYICCIWHNFKKWWWRFYLISDSLQIYEAHLMICDINQLTTKDTLILW